MDNGILNNLQLYKGKWFSDLVDSAKISEALASNPYEISTIVSYVFGTKDDGYSTSLDMITGGLGNVMTIDKNEYRWKVMIDTDRAVTIHNARWNGSDITAGSDVLPGIGNTPILLWLEDKWLATAEPRVLVIVR